MVRIFGAADPNPKTESDFWCGCYVNLISGSDFLRRLFGPDSNLEAGKLLDYDWLRLARSVYMYRCIHVYAMCRWLRAINSCLHRCRVQTFTSEAEGLRGYGKVYTFTLNLLWN